MPFLYETRTLTSSHCLLRNPISKSQLLYQVQGRNWGRSIHISQSGRRASPDDHSKPPLQLHDPSDNATEAQSEAGGLVIKRVHAPKYTQSHIPWEFHPREKIVANRWHHISIDEGDNADDINFENPASIPVEEQGEDLFDDVNEIRDLTRQSDHREARESTITVSERHAFQRIFSDIFARFQRSERDGDGLVEEDQQMAGLVDRRQRAQSKMNKILRNAIKSPSGQPQTHEEMEKAVNRYPPALRPAAARAFGLNTHEPTFEDAATTLETTMDVDQLEQLRQPERERVEALMHAAKTDFELWQVLEQEVFSLVAMLGLEDSPAKESNPKTKGRRGSNRPKNHSKIEEDAHRTSTLQGLANSISENKISPLALYGPLYPSYLLLGLRLLDRSFAKPSALTLSILPKVKSLGLISQVLGASTALYNELLRIYWYRQDNFRGVLNLLSEMENAGLDLDHETLGIVLDIMRMQARVARGEKGASLKALWAMPEFAPNKFRVWKDKIDQAISDRGESAGGQLTY